MAAGVVRCSLQTTHAVSSGAQDEGDDLGDRQRRNMRTPWLVVGRFDLHEPVSYGDLALAFARVQDAQVSELLSLEEWVNPQRMSQIRVVFSDPRTVRGEGDSIVSKIGAWQFVLADLVFELVGQGPADPESLAVRYQETRVSTFYVYFSAQVVQARQVSWRGAAFR